MSRAVPVDGTPSTDAAYDDPARCNQTDTGEGVCWRYWQRVGSEVRVWTTFHGRSCVLVGSLNHQRTTVNCDGDPVAAA